MSRLHTIQAGIAQIAHQFGVDPIPDLAVPDETAEGLPGLIVVERSGVRRIVSATWGFPRLTREMRLRGEPRGRVGLVAELVNPMWEQLVQDPRYRCLIILTHFANPDGDPGAKTRTWFSLSDQPILAWAGFCRNLPEVGPVYAGMTMAANAAVLPTNDRMPVLLEPHEYDQWLHGGIRDVIRFQFRSPIATERLRVEPTKDKWRSDGKPPAATSQLAFL